MKDEQGREVVRLWGLASPGAPTRGTWIFNLPTDKDGITRNKSFLGCSIAKGGCLGTFENCTWNGETIPNGPLDLGGWIKSA